MKSSTRMIQPKFLATESHDKSSDMVFTKNHVVDYMLKVSEAYEAFCTRDTKILEPSFGNGEFILCLVNDLVNRVKSKSLQPISPNKLKNKILAFEIDKNNYEIAWERISKQLCKIYTSEESREILNSWLRLDDFLLSDVVPNFDLVVGNPPYLRIENVPKKKLAEYRGHFDSMKHRADIYIAFFEKGLKLLNERGSLIYICTDRWIKNTYGSALRSLISKEYSLNLYVDLYESNSFQSEVLTYPAITMISREKNQSTVILQNEVVDEEVASRTKEVLDTGIELNSNFTIRKNIVNGTAPWLIGLEGEIEIVKELEKNFPKIEQAGCKVKIGAATGNNKVFLIDNTVEIEDSRKLPTLRANEVSSSGISWNGYYLINTYEDDGLISLDEYPKLNKYLKSHEGKLRKRHVAKKNPQKWYKTIDRVHKKIATIPKLLIPDIKSEMIVAHDEGKYHPTNSLYYITSNEWDLKALKAILRSSIGILFIQTYSTKIANGYFRFQAQHLRRIRIPKWNSLSEKLKSELSDISNSEDIELINQVVFKAYSYNNNHLKSILSKLE